MDTYEISAYGDDERTFLHPDGTTTHEPWQDPSPVTVTDAQRAELNASEALRRATRGWDDVVSAVAGFSRARRLIEIGSR